MHGSLEEISAERNRAEIGSRQRCTAVSFIISIARGGGRGKRARRFLFFETALLVKVSFIEREKKKKKEKKIFPSVSRLQLLKVLCPPPLPFIFISSLSERFSSFEFENVAIQFYRVE